MITFDDVWKFRQMLLEERPRQDPRMTAMFTRAINELEEIAVRLAFGERVAESDQPAEKPPVWRSVPVDMDSGKVLRDIHGQPYNSFSGQVLAGGQVLTGQVTPNPAAERDMSVEEWRDAKSPK